MSVAPAAEAAGGHREYGWAPYVVNRLLRDLGHRHESATLHDGADLVRWLEQRCEFQVTCCHPTLPSGVPARGASGTGRGYMRHWVTVDPHTGSVTPLYRNEADEQRVRARHMLWALTNPVDKALACEGIERALDQWTGLRQPNGAPPWSVSSKTHFMMIRTAIRTVQHVDAGLDLFESRRWIAMGVHPETVAWVRWALEVSRMDGAPGGEDERRFTKHLSRSPASSRAWLRATLAEWVAMETAMPHSRVIETLGVGSVPRRERDEVKA